MLSNLEGPGIGGRGCTLKYDASVTVQDRKGNEPLVSLVLVFVVVEMEFKASCRFSKYSTTELHPAPELCGHL